MPQCQAEPFTSFSAIWQLASDGQTIQQLVEQICAEYQVARFEAEADILALWATWRAVTW